MEAHTQLSEGQPGLPLLIDSGTWTRRRMLDSTLPIGNFIWHMGSPLWAFRSPSMGTRVLNVLRLDWGGGAAANH